MVSLSVKEVSREYICPDLWSVWQFVANRRV
jgi:hypothetical protein